MFLCKIKFWGYLVLLHEICIVLCLGFYLMGLKVLSDILVTTTGWKIPGLVIGGFVVAFRKFRRFLAVWSARVWAWGKSKTRRLLQRRRKSICWVFIFIYKLYVVGDRNFHSWSPIEIRAASFWYQMNKRAGLV